jgi:hypothetical protein
VRRARWRGALALVLLLGAAALDLAGPVTAQAPAGGDPAGDNPISRENRRSGSRDWQRPNPPKHASTGATATEGEAQGAAVAGLAAWEPPVISAYADRVSVTPGETLGLFVSTTASSFDLTVSRMGWYGGEGGRLLHTAYGLPGVAQPLPGSDPATGLIAANWRLSYSLPVGRDWPSGIYLVRLLANNPDLDVGYAVFVVRDDAQVADYVYKVAVNTYQAYNNWGGKSLYPYNSVGGPAVKVSFDRPYDQWDGAGAFFDWDFPMIRWLEREGYNVTYVTDVDAHADSRYLLGRRVLLSAGHDEYWSWEMRDSWEAARDGGYSLAFFSGNDVYWQVRYEPSTTGAANRVLVCYKDADRDPLRGVDDSRVTVRWRSPPVNRPENALLGVMSEGVISWGNDYPYVVKDASHWTYEGTGAQPGQAWSRIIGYEYDRVYDNGATPANLAVLSDSPLVNVDGVTSVSNAAYYRQGGMVFAAGTVDWAWALDDVRVPDRVDPRIQRVTANVLRAFRAGAPPAPSPQPASARPLFLGLAAGALAVALAAGWAAWAMQRRGANACDERRDYKPFQNER